MPYQRRGRLTDDQAVKIRVEYARGYKSANQLGREYGMNPATIFMVIQGSTYKAAGGPITWPKGVGVSALLNPIALRVKHQTVPSGKVAGHCWDVACHNPIASSGWAQRMHLCDNCFRINGGKKNRTKRGRQITARCRVCRERFTFYKVESAAVKKCCSDKCRVLLSADKRRKRPANLTDDRLHELYWGQNLTAPEIASLYNDSFSKDSVQLWLIAANIPRRRSTSRTYTSCVVEGCAEPIYKLFNGLRWYGRLCKDHLRERETRRRHFYEAQMMEQRGNEIGREIHALLAGLPESVKADAEQDIMVAVLSGEIQAPLTTDKTKQYIARAFRQNADAYKFISLTAPTREGEDAQTWGERLGIT